MRSPSTRRVWIEIIFVATDSRNYPASPSTRRVWIEISKISRPRLNDAASPSTRRVWIEMHSKYIGFNGASVTLHPEGVD